MFQESWGELQLDLPWFLPRWRFHRRSWRGLSLCSPPIQAARKSLSAWKSWSCLQFQKHFLPIRTNNKRVPGISSYYFQPVGLFAPTTWSCRQIEKIFPLGIPRIPPKFLSAWTSWQIDNFKSMPRISWKIQKNHFKYLTHFLLQEAAIQSEMNKRISQMLSKKS